VGKEEVTASQGVRLVADTTLDRVAEREFDLIVLPGGMPGATHLAECQALISLLRRQREAGKLYAAICAAPAVVLKPHGLLERVRATCYPSFLPKLDAAFRSEDSVVVDGNCVTAQGPGVALTFALELVEQLYGSEKRRALAEQMLVA
jgi:4-methyl-5(b-hydroxyethyl)-thiazole monophosphate biosynthesis